MAKLVEMLLQMDGKRESHGIATGKFPEQDNVTVKIVILWLTLTVGRYILVLDFYATRSGLP